MHLFLFITSVSMHQHASLCPNPQQASQTEGKYLLTVEKRGASLLEHPHHEHQNTERGTFYYCSSSFSFMNTYIHKHSPTKHHPSLRQPSANALDERRILPDGSGRGTVLARALLLQLPKERARYPSSNLVSFSSLFTLLVLFQQIVSHPTFIALVLYTNIGNATRQRTVDTRLETAEDNVVEAAVVGGVLAASTG